MFTFNLKSFIIFLSLFWVEVMIAVFMHDAFIRPFFGDFLAVIVLYYWLKSFLKTNNLHLILGSLLFSYFIEILQYFHFLANMGWQKYRIVAIILGSSFSWGDMLAYTLGALWVIFWNRNFGRRRMLFVSTIFKKYV